MVANKGMLWAAVALLGFSAVGCSGQGSGEESAAGTGKNGPAESVFAFLEAVRLGSDAQAQRLLTPLACAKAEQSPEMQGWYAPPGSDTASFEVRNVEHVDPSRAHVTSTWTDLDHEGHPREEQITWIVKKIENDWRISGIITQLVPGQPDRELNFEDPPSIVREIENAQRELERQAAAQARRGNEGYDPFQR